MYAPGSFSLVTGYAVDTMPQMNEDSSAWVRFDQGRANAPSTEESFPVLFNNRYFSGVRRDPQGSQDLWRELRAQGVHSGFFTAIAMEWGALTHLLSLDQVDSVFTASEAREDGKRYFTDLTFDYAVPDDVVVEHWKRFIADASAKGQRTFSVVHLMGSHYPFLSTTAEYRSTVRQTAPETAGRHETVRSYESDLSVTSDDIATLRQQYDRALGSIDGAISEILRQLDAVGELQRSVIVFTGDHGESFGERGYLFHGTSLFNEQLRIPLDFRVGQQLSSARSRLEDGARSTVASSIDLLPTSLDLLGLPIPEGFQGYSLLRPDRKPYDIAMASVLTRIFAVWGVQDQHVYDLTTAQYWNMNLQGEDLSPVSPEYGRFDQFLDAMVSKGVVRERLRSK